MHYAGQFTRVVGQIRQTVQCVVAGKTIGTTHLKAKVVRDLNKLFHADCLANQQLYHQLMDPANPICQCHHDAQVKGLLGEPQQHLQLPR